MKSLLHSGLPKVALLFIPLALCVCGSTAALAEDRDPLLPGAVRPGNWAYRTESRQGYLKVYSLSDVVRDGDARYFPHSSYVIYASNGKLFRSVKNHYFRSDEIPEVVSLPIGSYIVVARSLQGGYVRAPVLIGEDQETIIHLDSWDTTIERQLVHNLPVLWVPSRAVLAF